MPVLTITKSYADGTVLFEADLDAIKDDIENFINVTKINDDNVQNAGITGSTKLVDASVSSAKIASAAITTSKIADEAVTDAKIQSGGLTANSIATDAITTAKILNTNVTTAKLADGAVTQAKRAALGQQLSASCGAYSMTSTIFADVTNLSVSITTTGRPVFIGLIPDGSGARGIFGFEGTAPIGQTVIIDLQILRGSTTVAFTAFTSFSPAEYSTLIAKNVPCSSFSVIDTPSAGTYTYKVQVKIPTTGMTAKVEYAKLIAYEL